MTVAASGSRHATGRRHMPGAVRKAEARLPGKAPSSKVAANLPGGADHGRVYSDGAAPASKIA